MVELLAVIAIMAVIILIATPILTGIKEKMNESIYESKIANIKAAAESYSEESGKSVFLVKTLINGGKLEADNESGEYRNPVNGLDMGCYIVNVRYDNMQYYANVHEMMTCLDEDTLEALYGAVRIIAINQPKNAVVDPYYENFYNEPLYVGYELTQATNYTHSNIVKISWTGDRIKTCTKELGNIDDCLYYNDEPIGTNGSLSHTNVTIEITFKNDKGAEFTSKVSKHIITDLESPRVVSVIPSLGMTNQSGKRIDIEFTDGNGSGLKEYKLVKVSEENKIPDCSQEKNYKKLEQNKVVEYKDNGWYYTCVRDQVENDNQSTIQNTKVQVTGVDYSQVNGISFHVENQDENNPMEVYATITIPKSENEDVNKLKMCVSNTGHLKDCSWEKFQSGFKWTLLGNADCQNRTIYLSVSDEVGNVTNLINNEYSPVVTVKYYPSPGALTNKSDEKKVACYGGTYSLPNAKREGYSLEGWFTKSAGGSKILSNTKVNTNRVINLYAHWKINSYNISYNLDGGNYGKSHPSSAKYNEKITIDNPTKKGYNFTGWTITGMDNSIHTYGSSTSTANKLTDRKDTTYKNLRITAGTVVFKATWKPAACENCNVIFDANGGQWDEKTSNCSEVNYRLAGINVGDSEKLFIPYYKKVDKTCYLMERHYYVRTSRKTAYCNDEYDVYYANNLNRRRTDNQCQITHPNRKTSSVKKGIIQNIPDDPYLIGYYFDGWYTEKIGGTKVELTSLINGNMTLYAHWLDLAKTLDYNNYNQSKTVACRADILYRFIDSFTANFEKAVNNSQNFRNALYDCGSVAASAINASENGYPVLRRSPRTLIVNGTGQDKSCDCYPNKESKSAMRACEKPACEGYHEQFMSGQIYNDRIFVLSATVERRPPSSSPKCVDSNGYGDCDNEGSSWDVWGERSILIGDKYNDVYEAVGWGECNSPEKNAVFYYDCSIYEEPDNHIALFRNGLKVGLYSYVTKSTESGKGDKDMYRYKNYRVYVQIFKI